MRILQIIQKEQYRGAEIFCCQLSNHLMELGHSVKIVGIYEGDAILPFNKEIISLSRQKYNRYLDIQGWGKLAEIIREFRPDIIQANAADTLRYTVFSKLLHKWEIPIIYRNASTPSFYIKNPVAKKLNGFLLKEVDFIISVSRASKIDLNKLYPFTSSKSIIVPVGIENKAPINKIQLFDGKKNIIHIGSFTKEKNHKGIIDIFHKVVKRNSNVELHLIGEGPLKMDIKNYVQDMGLLEKVKFQGVLENPTEHIKAADVLILPSIIEGLPGVLLEAMYCKTPVVAYNVGGVSEIVSLQTGRMIEKGDEEAFAEAIVKTLQQPDQNQIENAHNMVVRDYLNKQIAVRFVKAYHKVVS